MLIEVKRHPRDLLRDGFRLLRKSRHDQNLDIARLAVTTQIFALQALGVLSGRHAYRLAMVANGGRLDEKPIPWVLRWLNSKKVYYIRVERVGASKWRGHRKLVVRNVAEATTYQSKEAAESTAKILGAVYSNQFLGKLDPREWDGRKKYP